MGGPDTNTEIRADAAAASKEANHGMKVDTWIMRWWRATLALASPWTWSVLRWECGRVAGFPVSFLDKYQKEFIGILQFL